MIATMLAYEIFIWIFFLYSYDSIPYWLRGVILVAWFVIHFIAYASEEKLRDRIKSLEDKLKNISTEKGGANNDEK